VQFGLRPNVLRPFVMGVLLSCVLFIHLRSRLSFMGLSIVILLSLITYCWLAMSTNSLNLQTLFSFWGVFTIVICNNVNAQFMSVTVGGCLYMWIRLEGHM
jgi:hypothetical protein